jgi:hypothetical protein
MVPKRALTAYRWPAWKAMVVGTSKSGSVMVVTTRPGEPGRLVRHGDVVDEGGRAGNEQPVAPVDLDADGAADARLAGNQHVAGSRSTTAISSRTSRPLPHGCLTRATADA